MRGVITVGVIIFAIAIVCVAVWMIALIRKDYSRSRMYENERSNGKYIAIFVLLVIIVIVGLITFFSAMRSVDTGKVGVVTQYGAVTGRELEEGFAWVAPWGINNVTEYDVKTQKGRTASNCCDCRPSRR